MFDSLPEPEGFRRNVGEQAVDLAGNGCPDVWLMENPDRLAENLDRLLERPVCHLL